MPIYYRLVQFRLNRSANTFRDIRGDESKPVTLKNRVEEYGEYGE